MTAAASAGAYFLAIEPYRARGSTIGWVGASLAVAFAVRTLLVVFFDRPAYVFPDPLPFHRIGSDGFWHVGGATIQVRSLFVAAAALVLAGVGVQLLQRTRFGRALEAIAQDFDAAVLVGLPVARLVGVAFALAGVWAGLAAVLAAPSAAFDVDAAARYGLYGLLAAAVVWFDARRALVAGLALGLVQETVSSAHIGGASLGPAYRDVVPLAIRAAAFRLARTRVSRGDRMSTWSALAQAAAEVRSSWRMRTSLGVTAFAAAAFAPLLFGDARTVDLAAGLYLAAAAVGLALPAGIAGLPCLAQGAFVALGAAVAAHLFAHGTPTAVAALCGGLAGAIAGAIVGVAFVRLPRAGFAAATWIVSWLVAFALRSLRWLLGGSEGIVISGGPSPSQHYELALGLTILAALAFAALARSPFGLGLAAARERSPAALALGVPTTRLRAAAVAAAVESPGCSGALSVQLAGVGDPASYGPFLSFKLFVIVLLGGGLAALGPPIGVVVIGVLSLLADALGSLEHVAAARAHELLAAILLLGVVSLGWDGIVRPARPRRRATAAQLPPRARGQSLVATGLGKRFGSLAAAEDVSLTVEPATITALVGSQRLREDDCPPHARRDGRARCGTSRPAAGRRHAHAPIDRRVSDPDAARASARCRRLPEAAERLHPLVALDAPGARRGRRVRRRGQACPRGLRPRRALRRAGRRAADQPAAIADACGRVYDRRVDPARRRADGRLVHGRGGARDRTVTSTA